MKDGRPQKLIYCTNSNASVEAGKYRTTDTLRVGPWRISWRALKGYQIRIGHEERSQGRRLAADAADEGVDAITIRALTAAPVLDDVRVEAASDAAAH